MKKRLIFFVLLLLISLLFLFNASALIASPGSSNNLTIQSCVLENNSVIKNNYSISCVGAYPSACSTNDRLDCDDAKEENASYTINHFAGVYIQVGNTSINNCGSVGDVFLCYKWKTSGGTSADCLIAVDANGNASWTNVSTACPGTSEPASATCVNITANESWNCNSFFDTIGTKAVARNEISRSNGGMSRLANNVLFFNITWYVETIIPSGINLTNPINQTINASRNWLFFSNASDNVQLANATLYTNISGSWNADQTNTTIGAGNVTTFTINNVVDGGYSWNVEWCDTSNNCAQATSNNTFTVNNPPDGINFSNPPNNTNNASTSHYFISSAADNRSLASATLYTNISGSWNADQTANLNGTTNTTNFAVYNISSGGYVWNVEWCDSDGNCTQGSLNQTFVVNFGPGATLNNPPNATLNSSDNHQFNGNYSDDRGLANASLYHNISGSWTRNQTLDLSGTSNSTNFSIANITSGTYIWNIDVCDTENICSQAPANFTFTVNSTSNNTNSSNSNNTGGGAGSGSGATPSGGVTGEQRSSKLAAAQAAQASRNTPSAPASNPAPSAPAPSSAAITGAATTLPTGNVVNEEGIKQNIENNTIANTIIWSIIGLIVLLGLYIHEKTATKRKALKGRIRKWLDGIRIRIR